MFIKRITITGIYVIIFVFLSISLSAGTNPIESYLKDVDIQKKKFDNLSLDFEKINVEFANSFTYQRIRDVLTDIQQCLAVDNRYIKEAFENNERDYKELEKLYTSINGYQDDVNGSKPNKMLNEIKGRLIRFGDYLLQIKVLEIKASRFSANLSLTRIKFL